MSRRTQLRGLVLLGGVTVGALLFGTSPVPSTAAPLVSYRATAVADGMRQSVVRPDAPLSSQVADSGVPSAQATMDGLGNSEAYGSFLYPGASALAVPGLVSGIIGQSLPSYPLIATSSDPSRPKDDASQGPAVIKAASTSTSSSGTASFSSPTSGQLLADAKVTADQAAGTLTAAATSEASAVSVAGVLRVASVRSKATAKLADGKVTKSSTTEVGETDVAGVRVILTDKGLTLPGQNVPLPDGSPILQPLKDAGITVELVDPEVLPNGVRSSGVRVIVAEDTPDGSSVKQTLTFGQALALVTATTDDLAPVVDPGTTQTPPPAPAPGTPVGEPSTGGPVGAPVQPGVDPGTSGPVPQPNQPPAVATPVNPVPAALGTAPFTQMKTRSFYLVLVLAGVVALLSHKMLRRFGVSATWTS